MLAGRRDDAVARAAQAVTLDPLVEDEAVTMGLREPRPPDLRGDDQRGGEERGDGRRRRRRH
jgi:hypothetical protein